MFHLEVGQVLITTTDEEVTIIEMTDSTISVYYRGDIHTRPKSIVGKKLFFTDEDRKSLEIEKQLELKKELEYKKQLDEMGKSGDDNEKWEEFPEDRNLEMSNDNDKIETCKNCMLFRRGDCFGEKTICSQFKPVLSIDNNRYAHWPKEMRGSY